MAAAAEQMHPNAADLEAFGLGRMDAGRSALVAAHVLDCESCGAALQETNDDLWLQRFREAATPLPEPARTAAVFEHMGGGDPAPPELADNPRYQLLKELGRGGMGVVYLAEHSVMRRPVALKVLNRRYTADPAAVERFRREIRAAARLHHPNIVAAYDADQAGNAHFLVMEYVEGVCFHRLVAGEGPLPVAEACDCVRQAALGLQHAHDRGMVHRDVKPGNLMRTAEGVIKVLDFGLAAVGDGGDGATTAPNVVMGTPDYIAPEQAADTHAADARSDIYALGCTLYFLLTGRPPFARRSGFLTLLAHRDESPAPLSALRPDAPPGLAAVLARMTAKAPAARYPSAAAVASALAPYTRAGRAAKRPWRRPAVAGAAVALFMALLAAIAVVVRIPTDQGDVTIQTDDPAIELVATGGGKLVRIVDSQSKQAWELDPEKYRLGMADRPDGLTIDLNGRGPITLRRKGEKLITVARGPAEEGGALAVVRRIPVYGAGDFLYSAAVSDDGKYALETHELRPGVRLNLFNVAAAERVWDHRCYAADFLDDDHVVMDDETMFRVCETATGKEVRSGEHRVFWGMIIAPGGKSLAYSGSDGITLYDAVAMKELHAWPGRAWIQGSRFSPDGKLFFFQLDGQPWKVWDVENGREAEAGGLARVKEIQRVYPGGKTAAASRDGEWAEVDVRTGERVRPILESGWDNALGVVFSRDGRQDLVWAKNGTVVQYRAPLAGKELGRFQLPADDRTPPGHGPILSVSSGGRYAAVMTTKTLYIIRLAPLPAGPE